jgi:hypothetical protein
MGYANGYGLEAPGHDTGSSLGQTCEALAVKSTPAKSPYEQIEAREKTQDDRIDWLHDDSERQQQAIYSLMCQVEEQQLVFGKLMKEALATRANTELLREAVEEIARMADANFALLEARLDRQSDAIIEAAILAVNGE